MLLDLTPLATFAFPRNSEGAYIAPAASFTRVELLPPASTIVSTTASILAAPEEGGSLDSLLLQLAVGGDL